MTNLNKYVRLRRRIAELEALRRELEPSVIRQLEDVGATYKSKLGTIYTTNRTVWSYSPHYKEIEAQTKNQLATIRETEQQEGLATKEEKVSVGFRSLNEN